MVKGKLLFSQIMQNSQDLGTNDEHLVSRVFFDLVVGSKVHRGLYADVKQTVGTNYETAPLEVSLPAGFEGKINYDQFRRLVGAYYRNAVGSAGRGIRVASGSSVVMRNNLFVFSATAEIDVDESREPSGW
jgi:hypothetical protein